jgi:hypothetical protein
MLRPSGGTTLRRTAHAPPRRIDMDPRESDPNGANSGGGGAGYADIGDRTAEGDDSSHPDRQAESVTPGVDETERQTITSGTAATSEVADRDAQEDAEGQGDGTPLP